MLIRFSICFLNIHKNYNNIIFCLFYSSKLNQIILIKYLYEMMLKEQEENFKKYLSKNIFLIFKNSIIGIYVFL